MIHFKKAAMTAAICLSLGTCTLPASQVEALDLGGVLGTVIQAGAQYANAEKALTYYNDEGRGKYMDQVKKEYGVNNDERANAMLANIMTKLSASVAASDSSINKKPYNYFVNNDKSFNAFCTLGHNMSVNIGAFETLDYNENELAVVIAHEMGHGQKNHPVEGNKKAMEAGLLASVVASGGGVAELGATLAYNIGRAKLITKPMEVQADELAFKYYTGAGYNIGSGAALWDRVLEKSSSTASSSVVGDLLNDHPTNVSRLATYNKKITDWSNGVVKVNSKTGAISLHDKDFLTPGASGNLSAHERSYMIAGNLSAVYHNTKKPTGEVYVSDNVMSVGNQPIMTTDNIGNVTEVENRLKKLL